MQFSVVEFQGKHSNYQCGYCKQSDSCTSDGMWAHRLNCQDYQDLIDRGWRRSGCYCYKPTMDVTCCPSYTIKCDALNFRLNKSHKKIIKKVHNFLRYGIKEPCDGSNEHTKAEEDSSFDQHISGNEQIELPCVPPTLLNLDDVRSPQTDSSAEILLNVSEQQSGSTATVQVANSLNNSNKFKDLNATTPPKKAKLLRIERKREKLQRKGYCDDELQQKMQASSKKQNAKTLEEFLSEAPQDDETSAHRLKIVTLPTFGAEFKKTLQISYALYAKYQTAIHNDPPGAIEDYLDFLVKSPLQTSQGFGTFHQQYWLDDRLIAVGVIDVLPYCVSSVYFFYDPEFKFLSLGTYGSLREVAYTRSLQKEIASIKSYYMGFYIHSCPKMRYKKNLQPSYLLCPETYTWHMIDDTILSKLDAHKYSRLNDKLTEQDRNATTKQDLEDVLLLVDRSYIPYSRYVKIFGKDIPILAEYAQLVGKSCAKKMLLYEV
ncbi:arginyl-tRNA--protein transferase 1 [Anopheles nili]|uniref:arginyl-tRNA--protein transferase 1 n=1 Tax=Anopheles nili TaxID=185578 RepID=UPI00237BD73E|nr:arginyl-tRNA--protein transferase 1 [Anopheles nili]